MGTRNNVIRNIQDCLFFVPRQVFPKYPPSLAENKEAIWRVGAMGNWAKIVQCYPKNNCAKFHGHKLPTRVRGAYAVATAGAKCRMKPPLASMLSLRIHSGRGPLQVPLGYSTYVGSQRFLPRAEFLLLLDNIARDGRSAIVLWSLPHQVDPVNVPVLDGRY